MFWDNTKRVFLRRKNNNKIAEFIKIYEKICCEKEYKIIENKRKSLIRYAIIYILLFIVSLCFISSQLLILKMNPIILTLGIIIMVIAILAYCQFGEMEVKYCVEYKNAVIRKMVSEINPEYKYKPFLSQNFEDRDNDSGQKVELEYKKSTFDMGRCDKFSCDDFF